MGDLSLHDKVAIREAYGRYGVASARRDAEAWLGCWSEDARWKTPHLEVSGKGALRQQWDSIWVNFANVAPFYEVGHIDIVGDRATATACVYEIFTLANGGISKMAGLYEDELERQGTGWVFSARTYEAMSQEPAA